MKSHYLIVRDSFVNNFTTRADFEDWRSTAQFHFNQSQDMFNAIYDELIENGTIQVKKLKSTSKRKPIHKPIGFEAFCINNYKGA